MKEIIPDEVVTKDTKTQISRRGLGDPCKIHVETHRGIVTLSGTVTTTSQKKKAVAAAMSVDGCKDVVDQLTIPAPKSSWDEDEK